MRRWFWALLILSAVALAVALFPIGRGGNGSRSYAHVFTATPGVPQPPSRSTWTSRTGPVRATRWMTSVR